MYFYDDIPSLFEIVKKHVITVHLLVDEEDYNSIINNKMVKLNAIDLTYTERKVRDVINFLKDTHEYVGDAEDIYKMLLRLQKGDTRVIGILRDLLFDYINEAFKVILNKEEVYLSDIINFYNMTPIYTKELEGRQRVRKI